MEWNGKNYREIRTVEEAEMFLGKIIFTINEGIETLQMITQIVKHSTGIEINNRDSAFLLNNATLESGQPLGIEEEVHFKLPELTVLEEQSAEICSLTRNELRIIKYCRERGIFKESKTYGYSVYFDQALFQWNYQEQQGGKIRIINEFESSNLCKLLNDNRI